jgi:DNA-binding GntR family transcriptional regulator
MAVAPLSKSVLEELYPATGALEGVAARDIAMLSARDRRALSTEMAKVDRQFRALYSPRNPDWDALFDLHDSFHRRLRSACAGPTVLALLEALRPQVDRYEWVFGPLTGPDFSLSFEEHDAIVREVRAGTAAGIERAVRANWFNGGVRLAAVIDTPEGLDRIGSVWDRAITPSRIRAQVTRTTNGSTTTA